MTIGLLHNISMQVTKANHDIAELQDKLAIATAQVRLLRVLVELH